jgi:hypothetical protein
MPMRSIALLFTCALVGCAASGASQSADSPDEGENLSSLMRENAASDSEDVAGQAQCNSDSGEPQECERDADCCEEFTCGWDPQVSRVVKVCVYAGSAAVAAGSE